MASAASRADALPAENARAYLASRQLPSGGFENATPTDACEALGVIEDGTVRGRALLALAFTVPDNNEAALARLVALAQTPYADTVSTDAYLASILAGELGLAPGAVGADPLVLAWALRLAGVDPRFAPLAPSLGIALAGLARPDGSYGFADNNSDLALTAEVARVLRPLGGPTSAAGLAAARWVASTVAQADSSQLSASDLALALLASVDQLDVGQAFRLSTELAARQGDTGAFDSDVRATALSIGALQIASPDLEIAIPLLLDAKPVTGSSYTVLATVTNHGTATSFPTVVRYTSALSGGQLAASGEVPVGALAPGESINVQLALGLQSAVGSRLLTAVVNPDETFSERNLGNNVATLSFEVVGKPDLVMDASDLTATPVPPPVNQAMDVTVRVRNIGEALARNVHVQLFSGDPGSGGVLVAEEFFNVVAPGVPRLFIGRLTPTSLQPIHLVARADPENAVSESNESNNESHLDLVPVEGAKLLTDVTPTLTAATSIVQGQTLSGYYGAQLSETRYGTTYVVPDAWPFDHVLTVLSIGPPGAQVEVKRQLLAKSAISGPGALPPDYFQFDTNGLDGPLSVSVLADADHSVPEDDETNNVLTQTVTVTTADLPELWIDRATVRVDPPLVEPGATFTVHGTLRNTGKRSATSIRVDLGGTTVTVPALAPGDCVDVPVTLTASASPGHFQYQYYVDPLAQISEGTRVNNVTDVTVYVGRSDLEIASVAVDPDSIVGGSTAHVTVTFKNVGTSAETGSVTASILQGGNPIASGGSTAYPNPGEFASLTIPVSTAGMLGDTPAVVRLAFSSWTARVVEQSLVLHVRNPDFGVTPRAVQIVRSPIEHSEDVQATVVVNNTGTAGAPTSVHLYRGYREQGDLAASGSVFAAAGGSATFTSSWFPLTATAASVITVVLDEENAFLEPNEDDNIAVRDVLKSPGEIVVAFEESRPKGYTVSTNPVWQNATTAVGGYADWARDLEARGFTVRTIDPGTGGVTSGALRGVDVLVVEPAWKIEDAYTEQEMANIKEYLREGGALLFVGEWGAPTWMNWYGVYQPIPWIAAQDAFLSAFGWTSAQVRIAIPDVYGSDVDVLFSRAVGQIPDHPAMQGISLVHGSWTGAFLSAPPGASPLIMMGNGQAGQHANGSFDPPSNQWAGGTSTFGAGRMAFVLDSNFFDSLYLGGPWTPGYYLAENRRFALQLIDWLAGGASRDAYPDLLFRPEQIDGPTVVTAGELVELATTVMNVGDTIGSAQSFLVRFYDGDPAENRIIGETLMDGLGVDEYRRVSVTWNTSHREGDHVITAVVDPDDRVREFDEQHNSVSLKIRVRNGIDLRVDPSDIAIAPGQPAVVSVRVHNIGYADCPSGGRLDVQAVSNGVTYGIPFGADLPGIPAHGATTLTVPWRAAVPSSAFTLTASAAVAAGLGYDGDPTNNGATREFTPPALAVNVPLPGTRWGGRKTVRLTASSFTRPKLTCSVAIAPTGGDFTGLPGTTCDKVEVDTTQYPDGDYVLRVRADDRLQSTVQDVPIAVNNAGLSARTFGSAPGTASVALSPTSAATSVRIPVGSRVTSGTLAVVPLPADFTSISSTPVYDRATIVRHRGALHVFYPKYTGEVWTQISYDDGATWGSAVQLSPAGMSVSARTAAVNASGIHLVYSDAAAVYYRRSGDGNTWTAAATIPSSRPSRVEITATDEGLVLVAPIDDTYLAVADAAGTTWSPLTHLPWTAAPAYAAIRGGKLHLIQGSYYGGGSYRSVEPERYADQTAYSAPVQIIEPNATLAGALFAAEEIVVVRSVYPSAMTIQRCSLDRDCSNGDTWLPEPVVVSGYAWITWLGERTGRVIQLIEPPATIAYGPSGGAVWSETAPVAPRISASEMAFSSDGDAILVTGRTQGLELYRWPGLTPSDVAVDVGSDMELELARPGRLEAAAQTADLAAALNAYLASHGDGDDGAIDGFVTAPIVVTGAGAGQVQLENLEIDYTPETALAGFAQPPVFSPNSSPGVFDRSTLSVLSAGSIVVTDGSGTPRRSLASVAEGGRFVASFDGRDDAGNALPSGRYPFGTGATVVAEVEIDNIPPTVLLRSADQGSYGGVAAINGSANDSDYAGTSRNFARYVLEYTTDGTTWSRIASSTSPVDGVLGNWDTRQMSAGPATLRLTAYDRAGNVASTSRTVGVSPQAPLAPVIDTPTVASKPYDSLASSVTIAGAAEPGTTVTVYVNGGSVGSAQSDGRWSLQSVALPVGVSTITASAARDGIAGPCSQEILVARYALTVALDLPSSTPGAGVVRGTATIARTSVGGGAVAVRFTAHDSLGQPVGLGLDPVEQVVALPPVGTSSIPFQLSADSVRAGSYTVAAEVVSGGLSPARAERTISLEPLQSVMATLASDKAAYWPDQIVAFEARLTSSGTADTGELSATILVTTPSGQATVLGPFAIASIPPSASRSFGALFGTPPLDMGAYSAQLFVLDAWSNIVATAATSFDVRSGATPSAFIGSLLVTPLRYLPGDVLQAEWSITNSSTETTADVTLLLVRSSDAFVFTRHDEQVVVSTGGTVGASASLSTAGADGNDLAVVLVANGKGLAAQSITAEPLPDTEPPVITIQGFDDGEYVHMAVTPVVVITDQSPFTSETTLNGSAFASGTRVTFDGEYVVSVHAVDAGGYEARATRTFTIDTVLPAIEISGVSDGTIVSGIVSPVVGVAEIHPKTQVVLLDGSPWGGLTVSTEGDHVLDVHAEDLAGNVSDARVSFSIDRLAPILSVAGVTNGSLYGAPVEPIVTVSDAHPLSPAWTATLNGVTWAGGTISTEGDWTLHVTANDAAGNAAQLVDVAFTVDTSAPVIHVSGVTDGLLTRNPVTPVITIDEPHPGSSSVTLDGIPFLSGTMVTAEGDHVLRVSATDQLGHTAAPVSIAFTRDVTPPTITITGVTDGSSYYVDATPAFSVSDAHPGTTSATLDGSPFTSGTRVTSDGWHTLQVTSTDLAGNPTAKSVTFRVIVVQAVVSTALDTNPRVLMVVNCAGQPVSCQDAQARVFMSALSGSGIPYDVALDGTTFLNVVRQNRHNVRVIYRSTSSATNSYGELRELTFEGGGLVVVNDGSPDNDPKLKETTGIQVSGAIRTIGTLTISGTDLGPPRTLTVAGGGIGQSIVSTSSVRTIGTCSKGTVVTTNRYGSGRVVTLTLNPEANDNASMRDLVAQSVRFAAGGAIPVGVPGAPQYVKLTSALTSPGGPIDMQLDAWTGTGLVPLTDSGTPTTPPRSWTFALSAGAPVVETLGVSAGQAGTYPVLGELGVRTGDPAPKLVAQGTIDVSVTMSIAQLLQDATNAVLLLPASTARTNALNELSQVNPAPATKPECDTAITHTINATEQLKTISGADDARVKTDRLLRALQVLYQTLP